VPPRKIVGQGGKRDFREPRQQQGFGFGKRPVERGVHRLLDQALRSFMAIAERKDRRPAKRFMQLSQGHGRKIGGNPPPPGMTAIGRHQPRLAQLVAAAMLGGYMALNIGANDVANNVGPAVGSKALSMAARWSLRRSSKAPAR
jgi:hypothetical protein